MATAEAAPVETPLWKRLPVLGVATAAVTVAASYILPRFAPHPFETTLVVLTILLVALAVLGFVGTKRGLAATFVAIALVLPYTVAGTLAFASTQRAAAELGSSFDEDFDEDFLEEEGNSYGSNPDLDALQDECLAGDEDACVELYDRSPVGSEYESTAEDNDGG